MKLIKLIFDSKANMKKKLLYHIYNAKNKQKKPQQQSGTECSGSFNNFWKEGGVVMAKKHAKDLTQEEDIDIKHTEIHRGNTEWEICSELDLPRVSMISY